MKGFYLADRSWLDLRVAPCECPPLLLRGVTEALHPVGHSLNLAALVAGSKIVEKVVVCLEVSVGMAALVVFPGSGAGDRTGEDVAEVEHHFPARRETVGRVEVSQFEAGLVEEIFACRVLLRIKVVNDPRGRKYPVLEAFVVVAVPRVGGEHSAVDCSS